MFAGVVHEITFSLAPFASMVVPKSHRGNATRLSGVFVSGYLIYIVLGFGTLSAVSRSSLLAHYCCKTIQPHVLLTTRTGGQERTGQSL